MTPAGATAPWRDPWVLLTAALMAGAVPGWWLPADWLDWQPGRALAEPWRLFTAAWVHWSPTHLFTNLAAAAVVGAYGRQAGVPAGLAAAWAVAWPLTHAGLGLLKPDLLHYGGLSGMLHGGVAITCLWLLRHGRGARRAVGAAVTVGLVVKLASEHPLGATLQHSAEWDIALAPASHLAGALAGLLCGGVALAARRPGPGVGPESGST